jgi:hypothetical protein
MALILLSIQRGSYGYGVLRHFQQHFSYIVAVSKTKINKKQQKTKQHIVQWGLIDMALDLLYNIG